MKEIISYRCSTCGKQFDIKDECIDHENEHERKYREGMYVSTITGEPLKHRVYRVRGYDSEFDDYALVNVNTGNVRYSSEQVLDEAFKEATVLDYFRTLSAEELVGIEFECCSHHDFCVYSIIHSGKSCPSSSDCKEGKIKFLNQPLTDALIEFFKTGTTKYEQLLLKGEKG